MQDSGNKSTRRAHWLMGLFLLQSIIPIKTPIMIYDKARTFLIGQVRRCPLEKNHKLIFKSDMMLTALRFMGQSNNTLASTGVAVSDPKESM